MGLRSGVRTGGGFDGTLGQLGHDHGSEAEEEDEVQECVDPKSGDKGGGGYGSHDFYKLASATSLKLLPKGYSLEYKHYRLHA